MLTACHFSMVAHDVISLNFHLNCLTSSEVGAHSECFDEMSQDGGNVAISIFARGEFREVKPTYAP